MNGIEMKTGNMYYESGGVRAEVSVEGLKKHLIESEIYRVELPNRYILLSAIKFCTRQTGYPRLMGGL